MKKTPQMSLMRRLFSVGVASLLAAGLGVLTAKAGPPATPQGMITTRLFMGDGAGTAVADVTNDVNFPNNPTLVYHPTYFESWATGSITNPPVGDAGDSYGDQNLGYFYPPTNGNYTFYLASDDNSALYLSTDSTPANEHLIAQVTAWANVREYGTESGTATATTEDVSSTFTGTEWPTTNSAGGATITLTAGQAYYIEALHKEGGGGDDCSVSIDGVSPIPGSMLSSYDVPGGPPTVASITGSALFNSVRVTFSEPLDPVSATTAANYSLNNGVTISSATLHSASAEGDSNTVVLATSLQPTNTSFTLTINNVKDVSGNTIVANTQATFLSYVWVPGWMTYAQWDADKLSGDVGTFETNVANGLENLSSWTVAEPQFDGPWFDGTAEPGIIWHNFNSVSYAWFSPPSTASYIFYIASDDAGDLFLSTDNTPANKKLIAQEADYSPEYSWTDVPAASTSVGTDKESDTFSASAWPTPNVITLTNGVLYYMEIDHNVLGDEPTGAGATYKLASDTNVPPETAVGEYLVGSVIGSYLDISGASVSITQSPASTSVVEGSEAILKVIATGTSQYVTGVLYQWQEAAPGSSTFANIPGAIGGSYQTGVLGLSDTGTQFRVIVSVPGVTTTSAAATVTVTVDTSPPTVVSVGALQNTGNPLQPNQPAGTEIGIVFDKILGAGAANLANYSLDNGATITAARYVPGSSGQTIIVPDVPGGNRLPDNETGVILSVSALNPADTYHLTVTGIQDTFGNVIAAGTIVPVTSSPFSWISLGDTVTNLANPNGATNQVFAVATNSFNLVNGGNAFWGTEDDITMVYETVNGDFDRTVQVEWSDPASHWSRGGIQARASINPADVEPIVNTTAPDNIIAISDPETNAIYAGVVDSPANNQYEGNYRPGTGSAETSVTSEGTSTYPASYVRLKRVGQFVELFYSHSTNEPQWWYPYGEVDFNTNDTALAGGTLLPDQLFVGPTLGVENGNILGQYDAYAGPDLTGHFAARFRNYSTFAQKPRGTATHAIGLKFACDADINGGPGLLLSSNDIAGVNQVAQGNWNDLFGFAPAGTVTNYPNTIVEENESTGVATPTTVVVNNTGTPNLWTSQGPGADTPGQDGGMMTGEDAVLMTGYLDSGDPSTTQVGISNIPPEMVSAGYDVIVYSQPAIANRGGAFGIFDASTNLIPGQGMFAVQSAPYPTGFVEALPSAALATNATTVPSWAVGNFIVFTNLKASVILVQATTDAPFGVDFTGGNTFRCDLNAIQLISPSGLVSTGPPPPTISASTKGVITYTGVLRSSASLSGPWTAVGGATSPYTIPASAGPVFYVATSQ
jgi:hypothetical protein